MAAHASVLAWRIPWTEEPGGLQFMRWQSQTPLGGQHSHWQGYPPAAARRPLTVLTGASPIVSTGCRARGFSSRGSWPLENRLSTCGCMGLVAPQHVVPSLGHRWNPCLLHQQANSLPLSHQGSPLLPQKKKKIYLFYGIVFLR